MVKAARVKLVGLSRLAAACVLPWFVVMLQPVSRDRCRCRSGTAYRRAGICNVIPRPHGDLEEVFPIGLKGIAATCNHPV